MEKIQPLPFLAIEGIGAASGIVYQDDSLFIVSDNSNFLYQYSLSEKKLAKIKLFENNLEIVAKKDKADFEALTLFDNKLYLFGSGSTKKRNTRVSFNLQNKAIKVKNLTKIYTRLTETISIAPNELNIEGVIITEKTTYFFQRGNGSKAQNGIFCYDKKSKTVEFKVITLPEIKGIAATFTDAILIDNKIHFLAAAEATTSTYDDGEIVGSLIGTLDFKTMQLENHIQISDQHKFEGLTLYKKTATQIELLLCEDNDSEVLKTTIYSLLFQCNTDC
jgi:hypothetical protein